MIAAFRRSRVRVPAGEQACFASAFMYQSELVLLNIRALMMLTNLLRRRFIGISREK
jgi:hypothetical protein